MLLSFLYDVVELALDLFIVFDKRCYIYELLECSDAYFRDIETCAFLRSIWLPLLICLTPRQDPAAYFFYY